MGLFELLFRKIVIHFFGFYTILFFYKLTGNEKGVVWLKTSFNNEGEEFSKGCLISIIGLISLGLSFTLIAYLLDLIVW